MNKKQHYIAPEVELVVVSLEAGIMGFSSEGKGTATGSAMTNDSSTFCDEW